MKKVGCFERIGELCRALEGDGAFLVVADGRGGANPMTIGWATAGVVWGRPMMTVMVRPSRHTFGLIERAKLFSVNVPRPGSLKKELEFCGTRSGRDADKAKACGLRLAAGETEGVTILPDCGLFFECEVVHRTKVVRETLDPAVICAYYAAEDYHSIYYGRILAAYVG